MNNISNIDETIGYSDGAAPTPPDERLNYYKQYPNVTQQPAANYSETKDIKDKD